MLEKKDGRNFPKKVLDVFRSKKNDLNQKSDFDNVQNGDYDFKRKEEELNKIFSQNENKNEFTNLKPKIRKTFPEIWLVLILILLIGLGLYLKNTFRFSLPKINIDNYQETYNFLKSFKSEKENSQPNTWSKISFLISLIGQNFGQGGEVVKNLTFY
jgi:hypothetical protein